MELESSIEALLIDLIGYEYSSILQDILYIVLITLNNFKYILSIVLLSRLIHFICDIVYPKWTPIKDLTTCLMGAAALYQYSLASGQSWISDGDYRIVTYSVLQVVCFLLPIVDRRPLVGHLITKRGSFYSLCNFFISISPILVNEFFIHTRKNLQLTRLRGPLMTLAMKCVSQSGEPNISTLSTDWLAHLAYYLHPASCILGPWHPFFIETGSKRNSQPSAVLMKLLSQFNRSMILLVKAVAFLTLSTAIGELKTVCESQYPYTLLLIYLTALEFRTSHYFVCYSGSSFLSLWTSSKVAVCSPWQVEWPNSLLQVVVSWNLMMSKWLKIHVFRPSLKKTGKPWIALTITYLISTLLHGAKPHIGAVLLSFCFLTYMEYMFRKKISKSYNACVDCNPCQYNIDLECSLKHSSTIHNSLRVRVFNFIMRLLAVLHLAYLGCIFEGDTDAGSYKDVISKWSAIFFYSHLVGVAMLNYNIS